jgi:hypothetical protein
MPMKSPFEFSRGLALSLAITMSEQKKAKPWIS